MDKVLLVRLNGKSIGILKQDDFGQTSFQYLSKTKQALSFSLPIQEEPFNNKQCKPYFGGLLPESDEAKKWIAKKYHVSANNEFSILKAIGKDCAGAVSFHAFDEPEAKEDFTEIKGAPISQKELATQIRELPQKPLFSDVKDFRLSLAGVQDKAAVCIIDDKICMPLEGCPTTHILKPAIKNLTETIENEYICLKVAKVCEIDVPNVEIKKAEDVEFLLIERYDREIKNNKIKRVQQEDFCQALGVNSSNKYQSEGGPNLKDCFDLLKKCSRPAIERNKLIERVLFNFLIGNTDAHSKNFSLLRYENGTIILAPMYDVLCSFVYKNTTKKFAMKIGDHNAINEIHPRHWKQFCESTGLSYPQLKKTMLQQANELPEIIKTQIQEMQNAGFSVKIANKIFDFVNFNCTLTKQRFEEEHV